MRQTHGAAVEDILIAGVELHDVGHGLCGAGADGCLERESEDERLRSEDDVKINVNVNE